jgi:fructuronate reductase
MLTQLQQQLMGIKAGDPGSYKGQLKEILCNPVVFGVNLYEAGLAEKVEAMFCEMLAGPGSVRAALKKYVK